MRAHAIDIQGATAMLPADPCVDLGTQGLALFVVGQEPGASPQPIYVNYSELS